MRMTTYRRLWLATSIDSVGNGMFAAAVPLLAVSVTRDPRLVSIVAAATYLPWLLLSIPAGVIVDRHDRVALMWRAQAIQAAIVAVAALLAAAGRMSIPLLAATAFGLGCGDVVFGNAAQAALPDLVPKSLLSKANGNQYVVTTVGQTFAGPPLGSVLFAVAVALPFGLDAGSFALSAAVLATMSGRPRPAVRPPMREAVAAGWRWLIRHRLLRALAVLLGVNTFCFQLGNVTLILLATETLGVSARGYGFLLAGGAVGGVLAGILNARVVAWCGALPVLLTALAANVLIFAGIGLSPDAVVLGVLLALNGVATTSWNIVTVGLRQRLVPAELLGRVNSAYRMLGRGLIPLGAVAGGLLAQHAGLRAGYLTGAGIRGVALLFALPAIAGAMAAGPPMWRKGCGRRALF